MAEENVTRKLTAILYADVSDLASRRLSRAGRYRSFRYLLAGSVVAGLVDAKMVAYAEFLADCSPVCQ